MGVGDGVGLAVPTGVVFPRVGVGLGVAKAGSSCLQSFSCLAYSFYRLANCFLRRAFLLVRLILFLRVLIGEINGRKRAGVAFSEPGSTFLLFKAQTIVVSFFGSVTE